MIKKKMVLTKVLTVILIMVSIAGYILMTAQVAEAAEGTQFNVGMLVDDGFEFMNGDYFTGEIKVKLSGWEVYPTGGTLGFKFYDWFKINDSSASSGVMMKKRFVNQTSGKVTMYYRFSVPVLTDGLAWSLNGGDTPAVKILTSGGNLCYENSSGTPVILQSYLANWDYGIRVVADLNAKTADIYVGGYLKASGVAFRNSVNSINYVKFNTGDSQTGSIFTKPLRVYKGYDIYEDFEASTYAIPDDWTVGGSGGTVSANLWKCQNDPDIYSLKMDDTSTSGNKTFSKSFTNRTSKSVFEYNFILPTKVEGMSAEIKSGSTTAVKMITNGGNICYENSSGTGVSIWNNYLANVWYKIKVVADPSTGTADIYVNGKSRATGVAFRNAVGGFDNVMFSTTVAGTGVMWLDDIRFYPFQSDASDYVPVPTPVAPTPGKYVGMQTFPGWKEGAHVGWDWPYRFPQHDLYMGTYDEENPEASDWQIKYMVEHGINFFMEAWYGVYMPETPSWIDQNAPIKYPMLGHNIHDAYFNSKYSSQLKFAIADYNCMYTSNYFQNIVVPFWMEYYLKDPRYMTIDNKPVIALGDTGRLKSYMGSTAAVKAATDYLRQQCVNAGFAGAIILARYDEGVPNQATMNDMAAMGIDYSYFYSLFSSNITDMQNRMIAYRDAGSTLKVLPAVSVGWSNEGWDGSYYGYVSSTDFQTLSNWVNNTFMPSLPTGSLGRQLVLADNWNEYGEGHWINPGSLGGFGYLDAIRNTFAGGGSHTDTMPIAAQKMRINKHFPKAWQGHSWNFDSLYTTTTDTEGWTANGYISNVGVTGGNMSGSYTGNDPYTVSRDNLNIYLSVNRYMKVRYKNSSAATRANIYFTTTSSPNFDTSKCYQFNIVANDSNYNEYVLDMSTIPTWTGTLKQLRFDPVDDGTSSGSFSIDYIMVTDEVGTPNLALAKTATMDTTYYSGHGPDKTVDGNGSTYAQADNRTNPWSLTVDLGYSQTFNKVILTTGINNYATNFTIDVSSDNNSWTTVKTVTGNTPGTNTYTFNSTTARYVRLHVTAANLDPGTWGHAIYECSVFN